MVTCNLIGRLGNNLFQIAATIALAKRHDTEYLIPECLRTDTGGYFDYTEFINKFPRRTQADIKRVSTVYHEPGLEMFCYRPIPYSPDMCISGFFQTEKYFADYRQDILDAFDLNPWEKVQHYLFDESARRKRVVSIHVRRADYLLHPDHHPVVTVEYLTKAVEYFISCGYSHFYVFSDDIPWCKNIFTVQGFPRVAFYFPQQDSLTDLRLMSTCAHNIISNSTFAWWGAWLNQTQDRKVICPRAWIGKGYFPITAKDIYPQSWIQM